MSRAPGDPFNETIGAHLERAGVDRRDFLLFCGKLMVAAPFGLALTNHFSPEAVAAEIAAAQRLPVIWLHMQECTGCTETLLRPSQPDLATLIFDVISLDYHETVMAPSGKDAELALRDSMTKNKGKYVLVVEGSVPTKEDGGYLKIAGKKGIDMLREVANDAAAVISIGSCASFGGVQSTGPNPTGATGIDKIVLNKPVVNIPGCPPNPYVLIGTVLQYARSGKLPALDDLHRPKFAYDRVIHDHCPRRPHFDAGRFAKEFGDDGHRQGHCLYQLGCKGPITHASCSTRHFNEVVDAWPIGIGHPCVGCTEPSVAFRLSMHETAPLIRPLPPDSYPGIVTEQSAISPAATGVAGLIGGGLAVAALVATRSRSNDIESDDREDS